MIWNRIEQFTTNKVAYGPPCANIGNLSSSESPGACRYAKLRPTGQWQ